jgi:hypothetical protein
MLYLLIFLQFADAISTLYFLKHTTIQEANPVLKWAFDKFGAMRTLIIAKGTLIAFLWYYQEFLTQSFLIGFCLLYIAVVIWNVYLIIKHRKAEKDLPKYN